MTFRILLMGTRMVLPKLSKLILGPARKGVPGWVAGCIASREEGGAATEAALTSSSLILPPGPVPVTFEISIPSFSASFRVAGNAIGVAGCGVWIAGFRRV